jgi:hypothetical protein
MLKTSLSGREAVLGRDRKRIKNYTWDSNVHYKISGAVVGLLGPDFKDFKLQKENRTWDSNVVPHRSTNQARTCLTSLSGREAVLSCWYGRSRNEIRFYAT